MDFVGLSGVAPTWLVRQLAVLQSISEGIGRGLGKGEGKTVKGIAEELGVTRPTVSKTANKLEKAGFIRREPVKEDGRLVKFKLLKPGRKFLDKLVDSQRSAFAAAAE